MISVRQLFNSVSEAIFASLRVNTSFSCNFLNSLATAVHHIFTVSIIASHVLGPQTVTFSHVIPAPSDA